jgi:integrase
MGTVVQRGGVFRGIVRRVGSPAISQSFPTRKAAKDWVADTETTLKNRKTFGGGMTLGEVLLKYRADTVLQRPDNGGENCLVWLAEKYMATDFSKMTAEWWLQAIRTIGKNGKPVKPYSVKRYVGAIHAALTTAEREYKITIDWDSYKEGYALAKTKRLVGKGKPRKRIFRGDEYRRLMVAPCNVHGQFLPMTDIIDFAIATCMRIGEICGIKWADLDDVQKMVIIRTRKHPTEKSTNDQEIPLIGDSFEIAMRQPRTDDRIFPFKPTRVTDRFRKMCKRAGVANFNFHDLRHVGITALFERGYSIQDVAIMSGHRDWKQLKDYVVDKPADLHRGPDRHRLPVAA